MSYAVTGFCAPSESVSHSVMSDSFCKPMDCSPPSSSVHGILNARILEWSAISSSTGSSQARDWTYISCNGRDSLPSEPPSVFLWWPLNSSCWHLWLLLLLAAFIGKDVGGGFMWLEDLSLLSWFEDFLLHQCRKPVGNRSRLGLWEPVWELQVYFPGAWRAYGKEWGLGLLRGL